MIAWLVSPVGRVAASAVALLLIMGWIYHAGRRDGAANVRAEIAAENARRLKDATIADDAVRSCALNPVCRAADDGFRRD